MDTNFFAFFLIAVFSSHKAALGFEVKLKPPSEHVVKATGTSLVLTCEILATTRVSSDIKIQWFDPQKKEILEKIDDKLRIYTEKENSMSKKLFVTRIENRDAGRYSCVATIERSKQERSVHLAIFKDITFDHAPLKQYFAIHSDALVECRVSGEPAPVVSWRLNSIHISTGGRYLVEKRGLRIKNITRSDDGVYTCRAEENNDGRMDDRRITVAVHVPPKMTKNFGRPNATEGGQITISCSADGFPAPEFKFFKDNKPLTSSDNMLINEGRGHVTFRSLRKEDTGMYQCMAFNDVGNDSYSGQVKVFVLPKIYEWRGVTKGEGESVTLTCKSHGDPHPNLSIKKEGHNEEYKIGNNDGDRIVLTKKSEHQLEMHIKRLHPSDKAAYICYSFNNAGRDQNRTLVDVLYKPRFAKEQPLVAYGWASHVDNITCLVDANPPPTVHWIHYDRILENNETYRIFEHQNGSNLQVRIKEADQSWIYGKYICKAKNTRGEEQKTINLNKTTLPDKPLRAFARETYPNLVRISVEPPTNTGGIKIIGYRVEYEGNIQEFAVANRHPLIYQPNENRRIHKNMSTALVAPYDEFVLENLKPSTRYAISIRAKNEMGVGKPLDISITTSEKTKPFPIILISPVEGPHAFQYKLQWEKPKTGGWPIESYEIKYRRVSPSNEISENTDGNWKVIPLYDDSSKPMVEYSITGLTPLTEYEVVVKAKNQAGTSDASEPFLFKTSEVRTGSSSGAIAIFSNPIFQFLFSQALLLLFLLSPPALGLDQNFLFTDL